MDRVRREPCPWGALLMRSSVAGQDQQIARALLSARPSIPTCRQASAPSSQQKAIFHFFINHLTQLKQRCAHRWHGARTIGQRADAQNFNPTQHPSLSTLGETEMSLTIKDLSKEIDMTAVRGGAQREHLGALPAERVAACLQCRRRRRVGSRLMATRARATTHPCPHSRSRTLWLVDFARLRAFVRSNAVRSTVGTSTVPHRNALNITRRPTPPNRIRPKATRAAGHCASIDTSSFSLGTSADRQIPGQPLPMRLSV